MSEIKKIGVVGAGTMGNGIAHVSALSGYQTVMVDIDQTYLDHGLNTIKTNLDRQLKKGTINSQQVLDTIKRVSLSVSLEVLKDCDILIEAVIENSEVKKKLFSELSGMVPDSTILASNTSTISITEIAGVTRNPERVIGMHFMNPVPMMQLVEMVRGLQTSDETIRQVKALAESMGKIPFLVHDSPGFVSNRILMPMINEAIFALQEGVADASSIDSILKLGMSHPMGPLALADFIGLDVCLSIMEVLQKDFGDTKYRPAPLLKRMVAAGYLGKKSKRGFYQYES